MSAGKRKVQPKRVVRGDASVSRSGSPLAPQVFRTNAGYRITKPRITPEGWVELDGSLIVDAMLAAGDELK